jgi:hypothetical protein
VDVLLVLVVLPILKVVLVATAVELDVRRSSQEYVEYPNPHDTCLVGWAANAVRTANAALAEEIAQRR